MDPRPCRGSTRIGPTSRSKSARQLRQARDCVFWSAGNGPAHRRPGLAVPMRVGRSFLASRGLEESRVLGSTVFSMTPGLAFNVPQNPAVTRYHRVNSADRGGERGPGMGPPKKSDSEPPARSQKFRREATSAVPGEAILSRLALQLARSRHRRELILHPPLVERRSGARLIPIGLPGRPAAWTTRSPASGRLFFMK